MKERCVIKKIVRGKHYIEIKRSERCEGCNLCAFNKKDSLVVPAVCDIEVEPGDEVIAEMPTEPTGGAPLLVYALPLAGLFIGALVGLLGGVWLQVGLMLGGMALGFAGAYLIDRAYRKKPGVLPRVTEIVKHENSSNNEEK